MEETLHQCGKCVEVLEPHASRTSVKRGRRTQWGLRHFLSLKRIWKMPSSSSPKPAPPSLFSGCGTNDKREKTAVKSSRCQNKRWTSSISSVPAPMTGNKTVCRGQRRSWPLVPNLGLQIRLDKMEGSGRPERWWRWKTGEKKIPS